MQKVIRFYVCGLMMGTADIIPGVSGGTMAWILGIYERLIRMVKSFGLEMLSMLFKGKIRAVLKRADVGFAIPLLLGILSAIIVMVKVIKLPELMRAHPEPVYGLFFGLIIGSVVLLLKGGPKPALRYVYLAMGIALGFAVVNLVPTDTADTPLFIFIAGTIAISAMLLPGVSGSFLLLIFGKYVVILEAISSANLMILLPFVAGCLCGLMAFSRALSWALERYHDMMIWLMSGLLIGTLWVIWPYQNREFEVIRGKEKLVSSSPYLPTELSSDGKLALAMVLAGLAATWLLEKIKPKSA